MSEEIKKIGKWLESTITDGSPERLDEPFPVKVTGLDILRMRDAGLLTKGAEPEVTKQEGISVIEVLIIIAILGILAAVVVPALLGY